MSQADPDGDRARFDHGTGQAVHLIQDGKSAPIHGPRVHASYRFRGLWRRFSEISKFNRGPRARNDEGNQLGLPLPIDSHGWLDQLTLALISETAYARPLRPR